MTADELVKLTLEEKRVKIAEACGWKFDGSCGPLMMPWRKPNLPAWDDDKGWIGRAATVPDYLNDLNAMHEAEKTLTKKQRDRIADYLDDGNGGHCATARQRADAFLLTI